MDDTGSRKTALDVFMRAQSLKTNDMFDSVAAAELEQVRRAASPRTALCAAVRRLTCIHVFYSLRRSCLCVAGP